MIILSHRGYWQTSAEKNTRQAFDLSFSLGFGTETDVRDSKGELVISHDMPTGGEMSLTDFLSQLDGRFLPLAINVKADGMAAELKTAMAAANVADWFVFDMAIPDMRAHLQEGNPVFVRMSEVEKEPAWIDQATGVWLDSFGDEWYGNDLITSLLASGKRVCVVSAELHGRPAAQLWRQLLPISSHKNLMLCTDKPEDARKYFGALL